jgi:hypothetical protein
MKKNSKTTALTQQTLKNTSSLRVYAYTHKEKECYLASKTSEASPKLASMSAAFEFPAVHCHIALGGQV